MRMPRIKWGMLLFLVLTPLLSTGAEDQSAKIKELEERVRRLEQQLAESKQAAEAPGIDEIRREVTILAQEVEKLRSGESNEVTLEEPRRRALGLGPSAATVYTKKQGVSLAGYGEMLYENFQDSSETDRLDFLRGVIYVGYRFNDRFLFNSEIEFEHASTGDGGEAAVEFAHIDYSPNSDFTLRGGLLLLPMGFINELHEPTVFLGARRTLTETRIIPSTWRENGFGIAGRRGIFDYRAYLVNGFNAVGFSDEGLKGGKQEGALAGITRPAFSGRLDASPVPGLLVGGAFYAGQSRIFEPESEEGESITAVEPVDVKVRTLIGEGHAEFRQRGLELRGLFAAASLNNVDQLDAVLNLSGEESIGSRLTGGYLQAGYNLLAGRGEARLVPFLRYERVNTQDKVPAGFLKNPETNLTLWTLGVQYQPILNVVLKSDYQWIDNEAGSADNQWNLALGYSF